MPAKRRKPLSHPSSSPAISPSDPAHSVVPRPAGTTPSVHPITPVYEVRVSPARVFDAADNLLSRARMQWQFGDWASLLALDLLAIEHHRELPDLWLLP